MRDIGDRPPVGLYSAAMPKPSPAVASLVFAVAFAGGLTAAARPASAWIDAGHKVVAEVAWEDLTPATRAAVSSILKSHPRYDKDLLSGGSMDPQPPDALAGLTPEQVDRRAFVAAAVWPDLIKAQAHPMRVQYGHSNWHYIDIPFAVGPDGNPAATQPADPPAKDEQGPGPHNVVEAIAACTAELRDPATAPAQRAVDVCWLVHLVGDVHEPLHAATLTSAKFPKGDTGGNDQVVLKDGRYTNTRANLHLIWDSMPGEFMSDDMDRFEALGLRADPRYARSALAAEVAVTDPMAWARESHALAVHDAYLDGHLDAAVAVPGSRGARTDRPAPGLPPGYVDHAEHVVMRQLALAGYRLADLLNGVLGR